MHGLHVSPFLMSKFRGLGAGFEKTSQSHVRHGPQLRLGRLTPPKIQSQVFQVGCQNIYI